MSDGGTELERVTSERDQYREALVEANLQLDRTRARVNVVRRAIDDPGRFPLYHRRVMATHRSQWPTLWAAIDNLLNVGAS